MEWTKLHRQVLGQAFEKVLGRAECGAMAFVRCLTPEVVGRLAEDDNFCVQNWQVQRVADSDDADRQTITADRAVEVRETKDQATLLLVDTDLAGAGMDGIYSASQEVDETSLFKEAQRLVAAEVTRRLSSEYLRYANRAIKKAPGFGRQSSVSPWTAFDFLCRVAEHKRHPGAYLHLLGLWPVAESAKLDEEALDDSRQFVDRLLGVVASRQNVATRIESLRLAEPTAEQRRDLEVFLHTKETQPLLSALAALADKKQLWIGALRIESTHDIQTIDLISWRNRNGKIAKWSGLSEESPGASSEEDGNIQPPVLLLELDPASAAAYSKLEVRWKAQPGNIEEGAVEYRVAVVAGADEELAVRDVRHSKKKEEKCRFSNDDFSMLNEDSLVSARVVVSVVGNDAVEAQESEEFLIRFGDTPEKTAGGAGRKIRAFSEGLIELDERESVASIADSPANFRFDEKSNSILLRTAARTKRLSFRVSCPPLIREVEKQWMEQDGAIGHWCVKVRSSGVRAGDVKFCDHEGKGTEWSRATEASRRLAAYVCNKGGVVGHVYDDKARRAFDSVKKYIRAWTALLESGDPSLALCNTVKVQSLAGRVIGLIVLPMHPLRVAWHAAYDNLVFHAVFEQNQKAKDVREEFQCLDGAMFPAFLPNPDGGSFVFADTLGFHAVGMVPDKDKEPKAAVAILARALGEGESMDAAPTVGGQSAEVVGAEIVKYLDCHNTSRLLHVHALRAGDGLTIARSLGYVHKHLRRADGEDIEEAESRNETVFSLEMYPSEEQRGIAGRFIAEARERRRSGAGVVSADDQWMLESLGLPGGVNMPRLRWARKSKGPKTAAHLAVAFDTFEAQVVSAENKSAAARPFRAFGLLSFYDRDYTGTPAPTWRSVVPQARDSEKHPSERGHSDRLGRLQQALQKAVARHIGTEGGLPVLTTEISPEKESSLKYLHRLCDWVITLDRNAGIEYFDSPRDNPAIYDAYVIDCVPEREDLGCLQLITSTSNLEEVRILLGGVLDQMGLSRSQQNAKFLLNRLKALSGRLAIRLTGSKPPTAELIALAVSRANCQTASASDDCWVSLEDGFIVPIDDVRDLLPPLQEKNGDDETRARPDLIYVSTMPRTRLVFRFIEVKYRRHLRAARAPEVLRKIREQTESLHSRWYDWYSHEDVCSSFSAVRRAKLAQVLRFYADKAHRHCLPTERHRELSSAIDRMIEKGGDYALHSVEAGNRGWVFCPEYGGRDPWEISPKGWNTRIFLFGPALLPNPDLPHGAFTESSKQSGAKRDDERAEDGLEPQRESGPGLDRTSVEIEGSSGREAEDVADPAPFVCLGTDTIANTDVQWRLTTKGNPHLLIAGLPGMGKTTCLLNLCKQMVEADIQPIIFSYHQDIDERLGQSAVRFIDFDGLGFNPLEVINRGYWRAHLDVASEMRDIFAAIYPELGGIQADRIRGAVKESFVEVGWGNANAAAADLEEPTFSRFVEILRGDPRPDRGLQTLLARLEELEDYGFFNIRESHSSLWESEQPTVIRIHATQNDNLQRAFASLVFYGLYKNMFRRGIQDRITHALIFDEAHRAARLKLIPTMAKECRKYGISLVLASQEAKDFDVSVFSAIANYLVLRLTEADAKSLVRNVSSSQGERTLIDKIKQMAKFKALYFCEGKTKPQPVELSAG